MRIHSRMGMVVFDETAFSTMLIPLSRSSFLNVSFINVDNSFAGSWCYIERDNVIHFRSNRSRGCEFVQNRKKPQKTGKILVKNHVEKVKNYSQVQKHYPHGGK